MTIKKYIMPLDYTGEATTNRVIGEVHEPKGNNLRVVVPYGGMFYTNNLKVYDSSQKPLQREDDFECIFADQDISMCTPGLEVCGAIVLRPHVKTPSVSLNLNYVGSYHANYTKAIEQAIIDLDLDTRGADFRMLLNKPEYFTAGPHIEDIGNVYGFEYVLTALNRIRDTLVRSQAAETEALSKLLDDMFKNIDKLLNDHKAATNPHGTTAAETGAYTSEEVDRIAHQLANTIELVRQTVDDVVSDQGGVSELVETMDTKIRRYNRRLTMIDNLAKNAIRRIAAMEAVPSENLDGIFKNLIVKQTLEVLGTIISPNGVFDNLTVKNQLTGNYITAANVSISQALSANHITCNAITLNGDMTADEIYARIVSASERMIAAALEATNATIANQLTVNGSENIKYDLTVGRNATVSGTENVTLDHNVGRNQSVAGTSTVGNQTVNNQQTVGNQIVNGSSTVRGNQRVDTDLSTGGGVSVGRDLYVGGNTNSNDVYIRSDKRLKTGIKLLTNCLQRIMKFKPVEYDKRRSLLDPRTDHEYGLIADWVLESEPDLVGCEDNLLAIRLYGTVALLIGAVQEQQQLIDQLIKYTGIKLEELEEEEA